MEWTAERISEFYDTLNQKLGLNIKIKVITEDKNRFPITYKCDKTVAVVPEFFEHKSFSDENRRAILLLLYCRAMKGDICESSSENPENLARKICDKVNIPFISFCDLEKAMRPIRRELYYGTELASFFCIGDEMRAGIGVRYRVVDVSCKNNTVYITVEPTGYNAQISKDNKVFEEDELFDLCFMR